MPKDKVDQDELTSFFEAVKDVKRLSHNKVTPARPTIDKSKKVSVNTVRKARFYFEESSSVVSVTQEDYLSFKRPEIANKILRKLQKGQYNIGAVLDLHGLTSREAEIELSHFFTECAVQKITAVILIHGKGKDPVAPILKNKLNQWLRHYKNVLAFCTSLPKHGGKGALYVLLRNC